MGALSVGVPASDAQTTAMNSDRRSDQSCDRVKHCQLRLQLVRTDSHRPSGHHQRSAKQRPAATTSASSDMDSDNVVAIDVVSGTG